MASFLRNILETIASRPVRGLFMAKARDYPKSGVAKIIFLAH